MGGIGSTLQIGKGALLAQQYGLNVTGNNIANVNNPDYSRQTVEQVNNGSIKYAGFLFGTGVDSSQVTQSVNQLLENRLTGEKSSLSGFEEAESYIKIIADHFNESSDNSISNVLTDFWNSWNDLSNNPADDSERLIIIENGQELSERFNMAYDYLDQVETEINMKLVDAVGRINDITADIAKLNVGIMGQEQERTSNDKRDQRNALIDELGELININAFEQTNGAVVINVVNGLPLVNGESNYDLGVKENRINWISSTGKTQDITEQITGGQIGGWLDIRDTVIPKYQADINELSHEAIWAINYQHSQGVGLEYFSQALSGDYEVDDSGWLTSLSFGDKIDHSKDLTMWIEDNTTSKSEHSEITMDMGVSEAKISNWQAGANLPAEAAVYKFTVVDGTTVGDNFVLQTDGANLAVAKGTAANNTTVDIVDLMTSANSPVAPQTLTITGGPSGTQTIDIKYGGGDAKQSAASIAEALNSIGGISAYASKNSATLDINTITNPPPNGALTDGDTVSFEFYVDGITHSESFTYDASSGSTINEQFEDAFLSATKSLNNINGDEDLTLAWDLQNPLATDFTLTSASGRTIGLQNFTITGGAPNPSQYIAFSGNGTTPAVNVGDPATGSGFSNAAAVAGTITVEVEEGMAITSDVAGAAGGLFSGGAGGNEATIGSSIITLGGDGGYAGFTAGNTISFDVDGNSVSYTVGAADDTDEEFAIGLETSLNAAGLGADYTVTRSGTAVSILKAATTGAPPTPIEEPIEITAFNSTGAALVTLKTGTGTGSNTSAPDNDLLISNNYLTANGLSPLRSSSTSSLYPDTGIIMWEKYDVNGLSTGETGLIEVEDAENIAVIDDLGNELLTFDISAGSLVAGNTLSVNINNDATVAGTPAPDPLDFTIKGTANSQNEIYNFKVVTGGTISSLTNSGDSPITIEWSNGINSGTFEIKDDDPVLTPDVPIEVEVDGMKLKFTGGTLLKGDVFTVTTDDTGTPVSTNEDGKATGELLSDWHWTLESFKDQFNKNGQGMTASINNQNKLELATSQNYHVINNITYSDTDGFTKENISVDVKNWEAMDFAVDNLQFTRSATGGWSINDPTGNAAFIPDGADDNGFGVDFNGDGLADIEVTFEEKITDAGSFALDIVKHEAGDIGYAFSDASGTMAALGFNTFFQGDDALTMEVNEVVKDTSFVAAATIDPETGEIYKGDNSNTLALADVQFKSMNMKQWSFARGSDPESSMTTATLDGYYSTMLGSLGVDSKNIQSAREFSALMVNYITEQRNSISAVSLDEEMIKLMEYQYAFTAASKLITTADEMMNTILGLR